MKVPIFWRIFLPLIVIVMVGSLIAGRENADESGAIQSQYKREISTTFDDLPLPPATKIVGTRRQEGYRPQVSSSGGFVVQAQYERPGKFADTRNAYRIELRRLGWIETYDDRGSRLEFCKPPYRLRLSESGPQDEAMHGFSLWLAWHKRQLDEPCR